MDSSPEISRFAMQLLRQDELLSSSEYKEYRMKLENSLTKAERREKLAGRIAGVSFAINVVLMFIGGLNVFGSFDPTSPDATMVSVSLGVICVLAAVTWPLSLASYYSRFRPNVRRIQEQLHDASILALQVEILELRKQISALSRRDDPA